MAIEQAEGDSIPKMCKMGAGGSDAMLSTGNQFNWSETFRYIVVGGCNAVLGYGLFSGLWLLLHYRIHYLAILTLSNLLIMAIGYWPIRILVFRSIGKWYAETLSYYVIFALCMSANYAVMITAVEIFRVRPLQAQLIATLISSAIGFLSNKFITFRNSRQ